MHTEQEYINYKDFVESLDEATPSANDKAVFNDANGPKGSLYSAIANFVLNLWAAFVNALTAKTSFVSGDKIPVVNGNTATAMEAPKLLELTAQNALAGNMVKAFDPTRTVDNAYHAGDKFVYDGTVYVVSYGSLYGAFNPNAVYVAPTIDERLDIAQCDIFKGTRTLKAVHSGNWVTYDFRIYSVVETKLSFSDVSGTNYLRTYYKNGTMASSYTITADSELTITPSADIYSIQVFTPDGMTIVAEDNAYALFKDSLAHATEVSSNLAVLDSDIANGTRTLVAAPVSNWVDYPFVMKAGFEYKIKVDIDSGTNYLRLYDANGNLQIGYTIDADSEYTYTPTRDIAKFQIFSAAGITVTVTDNAYELIDTAIKRSTAYPFENNIGAAAPAFVDCRVFDSDYYKYRFNVIFVNSGGFKLYLRFQGYNGSAWTTLHNLERATDNPEGYEVITNSYYRLVLDWSRMPASYSISPEDLGTLKASCIVIQKPLEQAQVADYATKDTTKHVVTVKKDGTGDYTTIGAALTAITDSALDNQYEIVIYPGVYNENYLVTKPYVHIHGVQPGLVTITSEGIVDTKAVIDFKSNAKLSNLNIVSHTGYCIHIDNQDAKCVVCTNVRAEKAVFGEIVGIGAYPGGTFVEFNGCSFVNGWCSAHTHYANTDQDNFHIRYVHCKFNQNGRIRVGLAAGIGNNIVEVVGYRGCIGQEAISYWTNEYRSVDEPDTYFASPTNWQIIGSDNKNFTFDRNVTSRHGLKVEAVAYSKDVSISGTAVDVLFGVTKIKKSSPIIKGAVYGSLRVDDAQAGAGTEANPYVDRFQMWKRLGDCSVTNKTLSVTVDGVTQTYTFDQDYTSSKPTEETILTAVNAVITNAVVSAYEPDFAECVNTTDKILVKIAETNGVVAGTWITLDGYKSPANSKAYNVLGIALEDGAKDERIPVWIGDAFGFQGAGYTDGEYGIGSDGTLDSSASEKIGFIKWNRFYRFG